MKSSQSPLQFRIYGMDCADEVAALRREVGPIVDGEEHLAFDILQGRMTVMPPPAGLATKTVIQAVARTGMRAEPWRKADAGTGLDGGRQRRGRTLATVTSGVFALAGFMVHALVSGGILAPIASEGSETVEPLPQAVQALYLLAVLAGTWHLLPKAWLAARRLRPDMNLLMTVAILGAIGIGQWLEAATVAFLFSLSLALESWSVARARRAIAALMEMAPTLARLKRPDGGEEQVPPEQVSLGARFVVMPGERFPLDGSVLAGTSHVNQAPITGESLPVPKGMGDPVFAGTINGDGALEVECTRSAGDTTLAQIIRLVAEAQSRRAPSETWVEKFARIYTPVVMGLALAVLIVPPVLLGGQWADWFYRSLVLLVIACPCALVISTPVSIVAALAASARHGALVKGGSYIEIPARLQAIALDKTGTLTEGKPRVVEVVPLAGHDERELLEIAASMESRTGHPLAQAIVAHARQQGVAVAPADDFETLQGKGASARFRGQRYWLGSHRYLVERGQGTAEDLARLEALATGGRSVVVVGTDRHVCGFIALADAVRGEARQSLQALREAGIRRIVMLTGDNRQTAEAIAAETGVDEVHAELLPADKV
ncbi:MAG: heavy metal translocating P-type ATPase, partial [Thermoguttaceae bacterium]